MGSRCLRGSRRHQRGGPPSAIGGAATLPLPLAESTGTVTGHFSPSGREVVSRPPPRGRVPRSPRSAVHGGGGTGRCPGIPFPGALGVPWPASDPRGVVSGEGPDGHQDPPGGPPSGYLQDPSYPRPPDGSPVAGYRRVGTSHGPWEPRGSRFLPRGVLAQGEDPKAQPGAAWGPSRGRPTGCCPEGPPSEYPHPAPMPTCSTGVPRAAPPCQPDSVLRDPLEFRART